MRFLLLLCASLAFASDLLVAPADLKTGAYRIVDVREEDAYLKGHIPGAVRVSLRELDSLESNRAGMPVPMDRAKALFARLGIDKNTVVVAYDDVNNRSAARLFYVLEFYGHDKVRVLDGGFKRWVAEGGTLETTVPQVAEGKKAPKVKDKHTATADRIAKKKPIIVDTRSADEFSGKAKTPGRPGHIPGALNIDWRETLTPDGRFKTVPELQALFTSKGVSKNKEVAAYCNSGVRASALYFALRLAGYSKARLYDGSWEDWGTDEKRPVEK
jgi:thiosulfate/3-mercaptopyruvate sulfurtransferase